MPKHKMRDKAGSGDEGGRLGPVPPEVVGDQDGWEDARVAVTAADGTLLDGYAIMPDAVLVKESELELPLVVTVDGDRVDVVCIVASHGPEPTEEWLALQLPPESIPHNRVLRTPRRGDKDGHKTKARGGKPVWCMVFPNLKGC